MPHQGVTAAPGARHSVAAVRSAPIALATSDAASSCGDGPAGSRETITFASVRIRPATSRAAAAFSSAANRP